MEVVNFTLRQLYPQKEPRHPINGGLARSRARLDVSEKIKVPCLYRDSTTRTVQSPFKFNCPFSYNIYKPKLAYRRAKKCQRRTYALASTSDLHRVSIIFINYTCKYVFEKCILGILRLSRGSCGLRRRSVASGLL